MSTSARRLSFPHPILSDGQKTFLTSDVLSGSVLAISTFSGFVDGNIAVIGEPKTELTESVPIQSHTDTTMNLTGSVIHQHIKVTPVYRSEYDQVEISVNSGSGWSVLTTINIQWDQLNTIYTHNGATDAYSYRFRFKNSYTSNYSEYSGTIAGSGYTKSQIGYLIQNIRREIHDEDRSQFTDRTIMRFLTRAKDIVRGTRNDWYFWKREDQGTITTIADTRQYSLDAISTSIDYIRDVRYRYNNGTVVNLYPISPVTDIEFDNRPNVQNETTVTSDDWIRTYNIVSSDNSSQSGYIRVDPVPKTTGFGSFYVRYYIDEADYVSLSDTTSIPLPSILEDYAIAKCYRLKGNEVLARTFESLFYGPSPDERDNKDLSGIALLQQMQRGKGRAIGQPQQIKVWRGRKAWTNYGTPLGASPDARRENYY